MMDNERDGAEKLRETLQKIEGEVISGRSPWSRVFSPPPETWEVLKRAKPKHPPYFAGETAKALDDSYQALAEFCLRISGMDACSLQRASFPSPNRLLLNTVKAYHTANGAARKYVLIPDGEGRKWHQAAELAGYRLVPIRLDGKEWMTPITKALDRYGRDLAAFAFTFPNPSFAFPRDFPRFYETLHSLNILLVVDSRYSQSLLGQINSRNLGLDLMLWDESTFSGDRFPPSQSLGIYLARGNVSHFLPRPLLAKQATPEEALVWENTTESEGRLFPYGLPCHEAQALLLTLERIGIEGLKEKSGELALRRRFLREQLETRRPKKANDPAGETYFEPLPTESTAPAARAPYDFFGKVRGTESLDRLASLLNRPGRNEKKGKPDAEWNDSSATLSKVTFTELDFSS